MVWSDASTFDFALKAGQPLGVDIHEGVGQDLQRDIAVELCVAGFVDLPHAVSRADGGESLSYGPRVVPGVKAISCR